MKKKEELIRRVTDTAADVLEVNTSSVRIIINEMQLEHFGIDGESVARRRRTKK